jgi:o-succinylbenzoate---CoA ligase
MDSWKLGLTISGNSFNHRELLSYSSHQIVSLINPWEKEIYRFIINWLSDSDHIIQYSSGTTGKPKQIKLPKESMMHSARLTCDILHLKEGDTALLCMPVDYIAGKMMIVRSMVCRLNLITVEPNSTPDTTRLPQIEFSAMVPLQAHNLMICSKALERIRKILIGGAEISNELENLLKNIEGGVYATYGMAETSSHIALRRLNGKNPDKSYKALPGIRLVTDERGCLVIQANWLPKRVVSNDLVEITGEGSFRWLGRYDNLINSGGVKIVPEEVEALVKEKTGVDCVAVGMPDEKLGHKLVLVLEKDQAPDSLVKFTTELSGFLPRRWKPKEIRIVPNFPRNDSYKIDRLKLVKMI